MTRQRSGRMGRSPSNRRAEVASNRILQPVAVAHGYRLVEVVLLFDPLDGVRVVVRDHPQSGQRIARHRDEREDEEARRERGRRRCRGVCERRSSAWAYSPDRRSSTATCDVGAGSESPSRSRKTASYFSRQVATFQGVPSLVVLSDRTRKTAGRDDELRPACTTESTGGRRRAGRRLALFRIAMPLRDVELPRRRVEAAVAFGLH